MHGDEFENRTIQKPETGGRARGAGDFHGASFLHTEIWKIGGVVYSRLYPRIASDSPQWAGGRSVGRPRTRLVCRCWVRSGEMTDRLPESVGTVTATRSTADVATGPRTGVCSRCLRLRACAGSAVAHGAPSRDSSTGSAMTAGVSGPLEGQVPYPGSPADTGVSLGCSAVMGRGCLVVVEQKSRDGANAPEPPPRSSYLLPGRYLTLGTSPTSRYLGT